ncbi:hypothetical protein [Rhizobium aethiopicum]|uniref:hypothetical protein n=1 Tax=Rhizobium aethiopicum TaxID=1138170 RepID=UPI001FEF1FEA|nr:hypothetical protein [Rhizobium aethiopicum]
MRPVYRNPQKKSVLFRVPGLVIGAVAFGAAGGMTVSDLLGIEVFGAAYVTRTRDPIITNDVSGNKMA